MANMFSIYYVLNSKELYKLCLNMPKMMLKLELTSDLLQQTTEEYMCIFYIKKFSEETEDFTRMKFVLGTINKSNGHFLHIG